MQLSVVIANYTSREEKLALLENCLSSFLKFHKDDPNLKEIVVSDDASPVTLRPAIEQICKKHGAIFVQREENGGYGKNANTGIAKTSSDSDILLMVNNDVVFTKPVISVLIEDFQKDPKIGIIGALLFYPDGSIQHAGVTRSGSQFSHLGWRKNIDQYPEAKTQKFFISVVGALVGVRKKMVSDIGPFDENLRMCREDTNQCLRAWLKNWKVLYDPRFQATHIEGATRGSSLSEKIFQSFNTRRWFMAELQTEVVFMNWLKTVDLAKVDAQVSAANASLPGILGEMGQVEFVGARLNTTENQSRDFLMSFTVAQRLRRFLAYLKNRMFYWLS